MRNYRYFDLDPVEISACKARRSVYMIDDPTSSNFNSSDASGSHSASEEHPVEVPVDPELSRCFECLTLIDDFRFRNDSAIVEQLMLKWN